MEGNHKGIGGSKICPFFFVQFIQQKVPPCELTFAQLEGPQNLSCSQRNLHFEQEPNCEITGITAINFLRPECRGRGLYVLKVTKSNKHLGHLLVAEEGAIVSAPRVGKLLISIWWLFCPFIRPRCNRAGLAVDAVALPRAAADPRPGAQVSVAMALKSRCDLH